MTAFRLSTGETLRQYVKSKGIPYQTVYQYITLLGYGIEEALDLAKKRRNCKNANAKYFKGGMSLRQYCLKNNLKYWKMYQRKRKEQD